MTSYLAERRDAFDENEEDDDPDEKKTQRQRPHDGTGLVDTARYL